MSLPSKNFRCDFFLNVIRHYAFCPQFSERDLNEAINIKLKDWPSICQFQHIQYNWCFIQMQSQSTDSAITRIDLTQMGRQERYVIIHRVKPACIRLWCSKVFSCYTKGEKIGEIFQYIAVCKMQSKSYWIFTWQEVVWGRGRVGSLQKVLMFKLRYSEMLKVLNTQIWLILVDLGNIIFGQHLTHMFWHYRRQPHNRKLSNKGRGNPGLLGSTEYKWRKRYE